MLYWLTVFSDGGDFFNLFRYITFRAGGAFFTALVFGFLFGRPLINLLRAKQKHGQPIRDDGPESHIESKAGTPTMGGVMLVLIMDLTALLWAQWNTLLQLTLLSVLVLAGLGFYDDWDKITKQNSGGAAEYVKLTVQSS